MISKFSSPALASLLSSNLYLTACLQLCRGFLINSKLGSGAFFLLTCSLSSLFCFRKWQLCHSSCSGHRTWSHPWFLYVPSPSYSTPSANSSGSIFKMSLVPGKFLPLLPRLYFGCPCAQMKFGDTIVMEETWNMDLCTEGSEIICLFDYDVSGHIHLPVDRVLSQGPRFHLSSQSGSLSGTNSFPDAALHGPANRKLTHRLSTSK